MGLVRPNDTLPSSHFLCRSSKGLQVLEAVNRQILSVAFGLGVGK